MPRSEEVTPLLVPQRRFGPGSPAVLLPPLLEGQEQVSINCSVMSSTPLRLCPSRTNLMIPGTRSSINHVSCVCRTSWKCISSLSGDRPFCSSAASAGSHPATEVQPPMKALNTNRRPDCARDAPPGTAAGAPSEHWPGLWRAKFQPPPYSCSAPNFGSMSMCARSPGPAAESHHQPLAHRLVPARQQDAVLSVLGPPGALLRRLGLNVATAASARCGRVVADEDRSANLCDRPGHRPVSCTEGPIRYEGEDVGVIEQVDATTLDPATVVAARSGDRRALDAVVEAYLPLVYNIVGRALPPTTDVDDVVQDVMVRVVGGIGGLREPDRFRSWLVAITVNQIREYRRQTPAAVAGPTGCDDRPDPGAEFVDHTLNLLDASQQRKEVELAARWLQHEDRELLSLWALERGGHLARTELVSALGLDSHHVTVRLSRMKDRLQVARLLVRALSAQPRCHELDKAAQEWPGEPVPLWRKRLSRHVGGCRRCRQAGADMVPAERLLAGTAMLPLPAGYAPGLLANIRQVAPAGHLTASAKAVTAVARKTPRLLHVAVKPVLAMAGIAAICAMGLTVAGPRLLPGIATPTPVVDRPVALSPSSTAVQASPLSLVSSAPSTPASAVPSKTPTTQTRHPAPPPPPSTTTTVAPPPTPAAQVLALINKARAAAGLPAYRMDTALVASASAHNQTMEGGCGLSHQCPGEPAIGDRELAAGVQWTTCGENIGDGGPVASSDTPIAEMALGLTQGMLDEKPPNDGHRRNILSPSFTRVGIAVSRDASGTVWLTQDFAN